MDHLNKFLSALSLSPMDALESGRDLYLYLEHLSFDEKETQIGLIEKSVPNIRQELSKIEEYHLQKFKGRHVFNDFDLDKLKITSAEYKALFLKTYDKKLTSPQLIFQLADIREVKAIDIIDALATRKSPGRAVKRPAQEHPEPENELRFEKRRRTLIKNMDTSKSRLMLLNEEKPVPFTPSKQKKIEEAINDNATASLPAYTSPGSGNIFKMFGNERFNKLASNGTTAAYKQATPPSKQAQPIAHDIQRLTRTLLFPSQPPEQNHTQDFLPLDKPNLSSHKTFRFTATQKGMNERPDRRFISPKTVMKKAAKECFKQPPSDFGSTAPKFHWAHLISNWFNGKCVPENLIPATGTMNLMMLSVAESHIAALLLAGVHEVSITVTVTYDGTSEVPIRLEYAYNYTDQNEPKHRIFSFNPRSLDPLSKVEKWQIDTFIHKIYQDEDLDSSLDSSLPSP